MLCVKKILLNIFLRIYKRRYKFLTKNPAYGTIYANETIVNYLFYTNRKETTGRD